MGTEIIKNGYKFRIGRHRTQITTYENMKLQTTQPAREGKPRKIRPNIPSSYAAYNYHNRTKQRRKALRELCHNNFSGTGAVMLTLTFASTTPGKSFTDITAAHREFKKFIQRMNGHYDNFRYVATFSRQSNGNWHYHVLCNLGSQVKNAGITQLWKNGITHTTYVGDASLFKNVVGYLAKNMDGASGELKGKHGYLASKSLEKDKVVTSWRAEHDKDFDEAFERINNAPRKILYETRNHLGIRGKQVNTETGREFEVTIPGMELNPLLERAGYESWDTIYTHLTSHADFSDKFTPLVSATPRQGKPRGDGSAQGHQVQK
ncbi:MAG: hypothetical protein NC121_12810 [Blautia sp.]|nr:hypothetical protein [Blautia sp.]